MVLVRAAWIAGTRVAKIATANAAPMTMVTVETVRATLARASTTSRPLPASRTVRGPRTSLAA
jgi:hypothetical protein